MKKPCIVSARYAKHLPFERQESHFNRFARRQIDRLTEYNAAVDWICRRHLGDWRLSRRSGSGL